MTVRYVAEIASAHEGSPDRIFEICDRITAYDDVSIKLQVFVAEQLCASSNPALQVFKKLEIPFDVWDRVVACLCGQGFSLFVEPYGPSAWEWALENKNLDLKISGSELTPGKAQKICQECHGNNRKVIIGLAGSTTGEIDRVRSSLNALNFSSPYLQVGFQAFPTVTSDLRIGNRGKSLRSERLNFAYADHTDGAQYDKGLGVCGAALALGYSLIEKHVTINREERRTDYFSSINAEEFDTFCCRLRDIKIAIDNPFDAKMSSAELEYRLKFKKYLVASDEVVLGDLLSEANCQLLRLGMGSLGGEVINSFDFYENLMLGKLMIAKSKIAKGSPIRHSDINICDG